jgi:polyisoprenoid-binding protein YceI
LKNRVRRGTMRRMFLTRWIGAVALGGLVLACNNDPAKDKAKAQVSEPATTAAAAPLAGATVYRFSQADSKLSFVGAKITGKHDGSFGGFTGNVQVVGNDPTKSVVTVDIDMATVAVDQPKLTAHLKTPDFFDVEKFPKARFTSTAIKPGGENGATHTVTGNLELHGVTKAITFPATIKVSSDRVDTDAEFAIDRKDFGIVFPGKPDDLIKDQVLIRLSVHAKNGG